MPQAHTHSPSPRPLPAPATKHIDSLTHSLPGRLAPSVVLTQASSSSSSSPSTGASSTGTTGTTLWLGAQVLACYLRSILPPPDQLCKRNRKRKRALELGSGTGYLALALAHLGWDVVATDIEPALSAVLVPNVTTNLPLLEAHAAREELAPPGDVRAASLDWVDTSEAHLDQLVGDDGVDMIVTTDTIYAPEIIQPLWDTIARVAMAGGREDGGGGGGVAEEEGTLGTEGSGQRQPSGTRTRLKPRATPPIYLALENRDPALISHALQRGRERGFELRRIPQSKIAKVMGGSGSGSGSRSRSGGKSNRRGAARGLGGGGGGDPDTSDDDDREEQDQDQDEDAARDANANADADVVAGEGAAEHTPDGTWGWSRADWDGVEVWKARYRSTGGSKSTRK